MEQSVIELTGLTKKYGSFTAVDHLTLSIGRGEVYGLLGPNGAGKSTVILMMLGLTDPTSGAVKVCGINPTMNPIEVKRKVGYLPEDVGFYDDLTGLQNLVYTAQLNGLPFNDATDRSEKLLAKVGLTEESGKKVGKYSRGMRQRLGLADVLIKDPEVIILDEPTLGIDPKGVQELLQLIKNLSKEEGHTVLLSSHHLHQVQEICSKVGLFVSGRLIAEGDIESLAGKLFPGKNLVIEAGLALAPSEEYDGLKKSIAEIEGVVSVEQMENALNINCTRDVTNHIVKAIIGSGSEMVYLKKKEYGLNEIYNKYFEGVDNENSGSQE